jgi:beta-galactosidase
MSNQEGYKGTSKKAFHGMCMAIVQSGAAAGRIRVTATSPGLKLATVMVATKG